MVDAYLSGKADAETKMKMRQWLTTWRDNDAKLQSTISRSFLLQEDTALSRSLSTAGDIGLQAMDMIEGNLRPSTDWTTQETKTLEDASKPSAQLLLMVVPP